MDKQIAIDLMNEVLKLSEQINVIANKIEEILPDGDPLISRRNIANMMAASDENLFRPILKKFPELEPHQ